MKKITAAATILVAIVVAAATLLFFLNQTDASNQTSEVRITAFSVDPEGWKDPPRFERCLLVQHHSSEYRNE